MKRWWAIILGFVFLILSSMVDLVLDELKIQIILKTVFNLGALISFVVSLVTDKKIFSREVLKNKWIVLSVIVSVLLFVALIIYLFTR